ncbi:MAG: flagellar motor protein MotB [Myxococcota bacterium]
MRFVTGAIIAVALSTGCVSKSKYAALEEQYAEATQARDQAQADADTAKNDLQEFKERNRKRLERFTSVYEELLKVQADKLAKVKIEDGRAVLQLDSDVLFSSGSAQLTADGKANVEKIAKVLADSTDARFQVEGHTDSDPVKNTKEFPTNWHLGADRAINVVDTMIKAGMPAERISAATFGDTQPVAANDNADNKKMNRRIELVWMPDLSETLPYKKMMKQLDEKRMAEKPADEGTEATEAPAEGAVAPKE